MHITGERGRTVTLETEIIEILRRCMIFTVSGEKLQLDSRTSFDDVQLSDLSIDSLASMQFCIELETRFGWSVTPEEFMSFEALGDVVRSLRAHVER